MFDNITVAGFSLTGLLGAAAFLVSVIVQLTKGVKPFSRIPTRLWCMIVSLVVCVAAYLGYCSATATAVVWYLILAAVACGFIASYIAMYGWDTIKELYDRFKTNLIK